RSVASTRMSVHHGACKISRRCFTLLTSCRGTGFNYAESSQFRHERRTPLAEVVGYPPRLGLTSTDTNIRRGVPMSGDTGWVMSSRSTGNGGSCVQARAYGGLIEVRNRNQPEAGTVRFTTEEWAS